MRSASCATSPHMLRAVWAGIACGCRPCPADATPLQGQMGAYGSVPPGMGGNYGPYAFHPQQYQGMYQAHQTPAAPYYMPQHYPGAGYGNPPNYANPGIPPYNASNAYGGTHAATGPHSKFSNYANPGDQPHPTSRAFMPAVWEFEQCMHG